MLFQRNLPVGRELTDLVPLRARNTNHYKLMCNALTRSEHWAGALQIIKGDGEEAWLRAIIQPVKNAKGQVKHISVYANDLARTIKAPRNMKT